MGLRRAAYLLVFPFAGCAFPAVFACSKDSECLDGSTCDPGTSRCVFAPDAERAPRDHGPVGLDVGRDAVSVQDLAPIEPDASSVVDLGVPDAALVVPFCTRLCPGGGVCDGKVPLIQSSFESAVAAWVFTAPSHRTATSVDGRRPALGGWLAEARVDWYETQGVDDSGFEQALTFDSLPPGDYRLCFSARIVSGADNCYADRVAGHGAYIVDSGEREVLWAESSADWCPTATDELPLWTTAWQPLCVEFQRMSLWEAPALGFFVHREGPWDNHRAHALSIDDVRLFALDCETAE